MRCERGWADVASAQRHCRGGLGVGWRRTRPDPSNLWKPPPLTPLEPPAPPHPPTSPNSPNAIGVRRRRWSRWWGGWRRCWWWVRVGGAWRWRRLPRPCGPAPCRKRHLSILLLLLLPILPPSPPHPPPPPPPPASRPPPSLPPPPPRPLILLFLFLLLLLLLLVYIHCLDGPSGIVDKVNGRRSLPLSLDAPPTDQHVGNEQAKPSPTAQQ